jgi:anti-anti-sigma factor
MIEIQHKLTGKPVFTVSADRLAGQSLPRAPLVAAALAGVDLSGADLEAANLAAADLKRANPSAASMAAANLTGADLQGAILSATNLRHAGLIGANLRAADLRGADLRSANLHGADLREARLNDAQLQRANLAGVCLDGADLTGARIDGGTNCPHQAADLVERGAIYEEIPTPLTGEQEKYLGDEAARAFAGSPNRYVEAREQQGVLVLTIALSQIEGEVVSDALRQEMLAAIAATGQQRVVVDFRNLKYISSVAFRPLLSLRRKLKEVNGKLILCGLSKAVGDVFYTTRLIGTSGEVSAPFEMQPDVESAVARLLNPV